MSIASLSNFVDDLARERPTILKKHCITRVWCETGEHVFHVPARRGRPPKHCSAHPSAAVKRQNDLRKYVRQEEEKMRRRYDASFWGRG